MQPGAKRCYKAEKEKVNSKKTGANNQTVKHWRMQKALFLKQHNTSMVKQFTKALLSLGLAHWPAVGHQLWILDLSLVCKKVDGCFTQILIVRNTDAAGTWKLSGWSQRSREGTEVRIISIWTGPCLMLEGRQTTATNYHATSWKASLAPPTENTRWTTTNCWATWLHSGVWGLFFLALLHRNSDQQTALP